MRSIARHLLPGVLALLVAFNAAAAGISIVSPPDQATVHDNSGNLVVTVKLDPGTRLEAGQRIRLLLDDRQATADAIASRISLEGIERGEHKLQALLLDKDGRTVASSTPVTFYMWQASRNFPSRRHNP